MVGLHNADGVCAEQESTHGTCGRRPVLFILAWEPRRELSDRTGQHCALCPVRDVADLAEYVSGEGRGSLHTAGGAHAHGPRSLERTRLCACSRAQLLTGKAELNPRVPKSKMMPSLDGVWVWGQITASAEAEMPVSSTLCHLGGTSRLAGFLKNRTPVPWRSWEAHRPQRERMCLTGGLHG